MLVSGQMEDGAGLTNQIMDSAIGIISEHESSESGEKDQRLLTVNIAVPETVGLEQGQSCSYFRNMMEDTREEARSAAGDLTKEKLAQLLARRMKKKRTEMFVTERVLLRITVAKSSLR